MRCASIIHYSTNLGRDETTIYMYLETGKIYFSNLNLATFSRTSNPVPIALSSNSSFDLKTFVLFPLRVIRQFSRLNRIVNENVTNLRFGYILSPKKDFTERILFYWKKKKKKTDGGRSYLTNLEKRNTFGCLSVLIRPFRVKN